MEAGMIDYRLCDRSFDCEDCPLDQALRGGRGAPPPRAGETSPIPQTIRFHRSHLWIDEAAARGEWIMGLDHHAFLSFSTAPTFSLPRPGRTIAKGKELLALLVDDEALRWPAPEDVVVLERNDRWSKEAAALRASPYRDGWVLLVKFPQGRREDGWMNAAAMEAISRGEREALKELVFAGLNAKEPAGQTAPDGGALIIPGDRVLPLRDYLAFLRTHWCLLSAER
jgi:glycine cleavage system H lipoate-binding protein